MGALWQVKDIIREHFGRDGFPTNMLDLSLTEGRRIIENEGNWWWMKDEATFNCTIDQQTYTIQSGGDIAEADFKDARFLQTKKSAETQWEPVSIGKVEKAELDIMYQTSDTGRPETAVIDNKTLYLYPPKPDVAYNMKLYFWQWTSNPTSNTGTDDLIDRFPMALVYASLTWGYEMQLKDMQGATYWRALLGGNPFGKGGELVKIKRENLKRENMDKVTFEPRKGPGYPYHRRLDNMQIYRR